MLTTNKGAMMETVERHQEHIGCLIAQQLTSALAGKCGLTYKELSDIIYGEFNALAEFHRKGDWLELPNGTTYTCTFRPTDK